MAWTPQQDLEETSSDGGLDSAPVSPQSLDTTQFSRTRTVARPSFCLSLPRDENTGIDKRYGQMVGFLILLFSLNNLILSVYLPYYIIQYILLCKE